MTALRLLSLLVSHPRVIDSAVNWAPYGGALKTTLYRHVVVRPVCYTYVGLLYAFHDASPFHVAAVPLAGNCRGDRSSLCIGGRATL